MVVQNNDTETNMIDQTVWLMKHIENLRQHTINVKQDNSSNLTYFGKYEKNCKHASFEDNKLLIGCIFNLLFISTNLQNNKYVTVEKIMQILEQLTRIEKISKIEPKSLKLCKYYFSLINNVISLFMVNSKMKYNKNNLITSIQSIS
eukprot:311994_1